MNTAPPNNSRADQRSDDATLEFESIVHEHAGWMLALAVRLVGDRGLAEDVVQESFLSVHTGLADFKGASSLKTWLHRIATNAAISKLRQLNRLAEQSIDEFLPVFDNYDCRIERPWSHLVSLADLLETDDIRTQVREAIGKLPESYRLVIFLRDIEGYDTAETSALLDITPDNVKVRLHRARAALKHILEPQLRGEIGS